MTTDFPDVCPQSRQFTAGKYAVKKFNSISGASTTRLYGSQPFDAQLQLRYFLGDTEMAQFLTSWHTSKGGAGIVNLGPGIYGGIDPTLAGQIKSYSWRWESPPQVESVLPGRSRIQVSLIGTLDA